jgi:hypothetical protein
MASPSCSSSRRSEGPGTMPQPPGDLGLLSAMVTLSPNARVRTHRVRMWQTADVHTP